MARKRFRNPGEGSVAGEWQERMGEPGSGALGIEGGGFLRLTSGEGPGTEEIGSIEGVGAGPKA